MLLLFMCSVALNSIHLERLRLKPYIPDSAKYIQSPYTKSITSYIKSIQIPLHIPYTLPILIIFFNVYMLCQIGSVGFVYGMNDVGCIHCLYSQNSPYYFFLLCACIFSVYLSAEALLLMSEWSSDVLIFLNHWNVSGKHLFISFPLNNSCRPVYLGYSKQIICPIACKFVFRTCIFD